MGRLWELYREWSDRQPFPPSQRRFAEAIPMSPTAFGNWQKPLTRLPDGTNLARFAYLIHASYDAVLEAALYDARYLPEPISQPGLLDTTLGQVADEAGGGSSPPSELVPVPDDILRDPRRLEDWLHDRDQSMANEDAGLLAARRSTRHPPRGQRKQKAD